MDDKNITKWKTLYHAGIADMRLGKIENAVYNWMEAYEILPGKMENIYKLINYYTTAAKHNIALHFYNIYKNTAKSRPGEECSGEECSEDYDKDVYTFKCDYEYIIFAYYLKIKNISDQIISVLNNCGNPNLITNMFNNIKFYDLAIRAEKTVDLSFEFTKNINDVTYTFRSSTGCIVKKDDLYAMNIRIVNYYIHEKGHYIGCNPSLISINKYIELDKTFSIVKEKEFDGKWNFNKIMGIEDIRLFNGKYIGAGYNSKNKIGILYGDYDITKNSLEFTELQSSFNDAYCEKNWVFVDYKKEPHVIYEWYPIKICNIENDKITVIAEKPTPWIFKYIRGSTCGIEHNNEIWFVGHIVSVSENPRNYYHIFIVFDQNMDLLRYSAPFKFSGKTIEYCIGMIFEDNKVILSYSEWDRTTKISIYDEKYIESLCHFF